jgi:hypothetical protein
MCRTAAESPPMVHDGAGNGAIFYDRSRMSAGPHSEKMRVVAVTGCKEPLQLVCNNLKLFIKTDM